MHVPVEVDLQRNAESVRTVQSVVLKERTTRSNRPVHLKSRNELSERLPVVTNATAVAASSYFLVQLILNSFILVTASITPSPPSHCHNQTSFLDVSFLITLINLITLLNVRSFISRCRIFNSLSHLRNYLIEAATSSSTRARNVIKMYMITPEYISSYQS